MGKVRIASFGEEAEESKKAEAQTSESQSEKKKKQRNKKTVARVRSKSYSEKASLVDKKTKYSISEALDLIEKLKRAKFDETVELHLNTTKTGQMGTITLPHGTGKATRVAVASDELIAEIEKGKIDFDVLLSTADMMPKLARVARVLGPRGLMPNPKNGTVVKDPANAAKQFEAGQLTIKTESKFPIIHLSVGKVSFGKDKLTENIKAAVETIKTSNIKNATLKSTMSAGVKIQIA